MTRQEIEQLAETQWKQLGSQNEDWKMLWIDGFINGYLNAKVDDLSNQMDRLNTRIANLDNQIDLRHKNIAEMLINGLDCHYSGLPSPKAYDI